MNNNSNTVVKQDLVKQVDGRAAHMTQLGTRAGRAQHPPPPLPDHAGIPAELYSTVLMQHS